MSQRIPLGGPDAGHRAVAVVVRGNKLLVIARRLDGRAYAVLPGGRVEPSETAEQAAVRELAEECTLTGTSARHLFDGDQGGRFASYFLVDVPEGEPVLGGPEADAQSEDNRFQPLWATAGELPMLGLLPEGIGDLVTEAVWPLRVDQIGPEDWPLLERLWQLYQHDLSEFRHSAPDAEGLFDAGRLPAYRDDPDRVGYLARLGDVPCGFALVRLGVRRDRRTMGEFFVTRSARGCGVAAAFAREVLTRHPGAWLVPFQNENPRAAAFWRRLIAEVLDDVSERLLPIPGKPHLPPDVWLTGVMR
ncbi:MAG TPA: GNAT family N-acetyltransferase [Nocardioides sp.]|uniref:GNAT family N-acetyltransferase n=1 Tax=Nocardioides sp. TaxID=35761 RepID=UPI002F3EBC5C